jgi:hypothetical protein
MLLPFDERSVAEQRTIIGPQGEFHSPTDLLVVSQEERAEIISGTKVIFIWGEAIYRDIFGTRWRFDFRGRNSERRMRITDSAGIVSPGWGFSPLSYEETEV